LDIGVGKTIIKKNIHLSSAVYDTLSINRESDTRWSLPMKEIDFVLKAYKKFGKRSVVHLANRTYWLDQKRIFQNDQIQLGGSKTIRGFNENQFFSNRFTYFTAEYRLLLTQNTYLFGFGDYGILKDDATHQSYNPIGLGMGLTYDTPAGVVSFSYAVGKVGDIPFQPTRGKIHVGLVSQF
jgi:hemolysin activation/secretion protein